MRRIIISKSGNTLAGSPPSGYETPSRAALTVQTVEAFQERRSENRTDRRPQSCLAILQSRAIYGRPVDGKARARAEALAKAQGEPLTNEEALEIIRRARETEAALLTEEQAEAKAKRMEFIRRKQSAMAGLNRAV